MENRKGSGIFLGVVSVATLVVAIIGATFAYFSASVTANNTVGLTAYEFDADITLTPIAPTTAASLIPLLPEGTLADGVSTDYTTNLPYAMNTAKCIDSRGYQVCALYEVSVTNNGGKEIKLSGTLNTISNANPNNSNKFTNLKYQALTETAGVYSYTPGTAVAMQTVTTTPADDGEGEPTVTVTDNVITLESMTIPTGETRKAYFVIYLNDVEDTVAGSNNSEMGVQYVGEVTYTDSTSGSKLTGTFTVSNSEA